MVHFSFFSQDPYNTVVSHLKELELGVLDSVYMYETETGNQYTACYYRMTCPLLMELMREEYGEKKLIYGENEYGYPLYWKIWW